jgi:hypothetical protein
VGHVSLGKNSTAKVPGSKGIANFHFDAFLRKIKAVSFFTLQKPIVELYLQFA